MSLISILSSKTVIIISLLIVICAVFLRDYSEIVFNKFWNYDQKVILNSTNSVYLFTLAELSRFNGEDKHSIYMSLLGSVYDVSKGSKHYQKGASYHYFVGKDGSRAMVTGNFNDESPEQDHVLDLSCAELIGLVSWRNTYKQKYVFKGKLIGRYYNENGESTEYMRQLKHKIKQCRIEKKLAEQNNEKYPPCNIEWSMNDGSKVWCSKNSGGVTRNWVGVPRQLYTPGEEKSMCVCINLEHDNSALMLKEYDDCPTMAISCKIPN